MLGRLFPLERRGCKLIVELCGLLPSEAEIKSLLKRFRYLIQNKPLGTCVREEFLEGVRWAGDNGYLFELVLDFQNCGVRQLEEALRLVQQTPQTVFIIGTTFISRLMEDHVAKPDLKT